MHGFRQHWLRHTAMVPKGFLRYEVLELLSEKQMSGSEIINEVEKKTDGCWKPSPGSIYPLLAWLQDNGYVKELPTDESGMKRYTLTDKGKTLLEEQRKIKTEFKKESRPFWLQFPPPFIKSPWFRMPKEATLEVRKSMRRFFRTFFELGDLSEKSSEKFISKALKVIDETTGKLEKIKRELKEDMDE